MDSIKIAAIQMTSSCDLNKNIKTIKNLIKKVKLNNADAVVLPEYWPLISSNESDKLLIAEEFGNGFLQDNLKKLAIDNNIIIFAGTIPLRSKIKNKINNSLLVFNQNGECIYRYDKMHLFNYNSTEETFKESDTIVSGNNIPNFQLNGFKFALGICYDLRFPEFFRKQGVFDTLILPAAFTFNTGKAHWEVLLRARAIENQCYVVTSAQSGLHPSGRKTYGNTMIIDPWGEILAKMNDKNQGFIIQDIYLKKIKQIRNNLPSIYNKYL